MAQLSQKILIPSFNFYSSFTTYSNYHIFVRLRSQDLSLSKRFFRFSICNFSIDKEQGTNNKDAAAVNDKKDTNAGNIASKDILSKKGVNNKNVAQQQIPEDDLDLKSWNLSKKKITKPEDEIVLKVQVKNKSRAKTDFSKVYTANIFVTITRAMNEFMLESSELENLPKFIRRSPYPERDNITVFRRKDLEQRAIIKWGSIENLQLQKNFVANNRDRQRTKFDLRREIKEYLKDHESEKTSLDDKPFMHTPPNQFSSGFQEQSFFKLRSARVVLYAIAINSVNTLIKCVAWLYTGSNSMFSEFVHSLADTINQIILAAGIRQSLKVPDINHPYGWSNFRNVSSLISGVGIFCIGAGLSMYHGVTGLMYPHESTNLYWALATLCGSFLSEGGTLLIALNEIKQSSKAQNMSFFEYMARGRDPSTNVVLLEDSAAVIGILIAASCIGITHYTGSPFADSVGSLLIGTLLSGIASFIIYTNTKILVGVSIPAERRLQLMKELEGDRMIRTIHDLKATETGGRFVRFKAEVDFDGHELTRYYLEQQDIEAMLKEMQSMKSIEEVESFMLLHGERIVDTLGSQVDRIEKDLKKRHPEIRHCDLEQL